MNKVISSNIGGIVFNLDENAYHTLMNYIEQVKINLSKEKSRDEIIQDIELRIAELLGSKKSDSQLVISEKDIHEVIELMGRPEDFAGENSSQEEKEASKASNSQRALYRDTEEAQLAGVCAGLASYFGMDKTIVRIIAVILLFFFGFALPLYIILWIVVPEAKTSAEKLKMRGEPVTIENIKKEVSEAAGRLKNNRFAKDVKSKWDEKSHSFSPIIDRIKRILGLFILVTSFFLFASFCIFIVADNSYIFGDGDGISSFSLLSDLIFRTSSQVIMGWVGFLIFFLVPLLLMFLWGLRWLFRLNKKWVNPIRAFLWVVWGLNWVIIFIVIAQVGNEFTNRVSIKDELASTSLKNLTISVGESRQDEDYRHLGFRVENNKIYCNQVEVEVVTSMDSLVHIYTEVEAYGTTRKIAKLRAQSIQYEAHLENGVLNLSPLISFPKMYKYRGQELRVTVALPPNTEIDWEGDSDLVCGGEDEVED